MSTVPSQVRIREIMNFAWRDVRVTGPTSGFRSAELADIVLRRGGHLFVGIGNPLAEWASTG